jgi:hypothetical protein
MAAKIDSAGNPGSMDTAYLMTQIGPGTTSAEQLATSTFTAEQQFPTAPMTLFSGLTLEPGSHYLVLSLPNIGVDTSCVVGIFCKPVTAPEVTLISSGFGLSGAYGPAASFTMTPSLYIETLISGTAVPEPGTLSIAAPGLIGLGVSTTRKRVHPSVTI